MHPLKIQDWFDSREAARSAFLARAGWAGAALSPIGEDCAFRRYFRLRQGERTAILMEAVPDGAAIATPGHRLADFIRIGANLRAAGLHTPEVFAAEEENGYLLLEDFGDVSFKKALACHLEPQAKDPMELLHCAQNDRDSLYQLATDVLLVLKNVSAEGLPDYYQSHVHQGRRRVVDWYLPAVRGRRNPDGFAEEYLAVWEEIEQSLPPCPQGFLHIDYHVENLMWLPQAQGLARCGILDFQGAMRGPLPYDLANLLEDARLEMPVELRAAMVARYCAGMTREEREAFENWYRVLATQFHCRVAGQFIRLAVRDGKDRYLAHLPRVTRYLQEGFAHPVLAPLRRRFAAQGVTFEQAPAVEVDKLRSLIRDDAF